jgi:hypothetical protein
MTPSTLSSESQPISRPAWLCAESVSGGPWLAMTIAEDRVMALAPQALLVSPPADLKVVLLFQEGGAFGRQVPALRIDVPPGQLAESDLWAGVVWLRDAIGSADDLRLRLDPKEVRRAAAAYPHDPWAALEDAGAFPSGGRRDLSTREVIDSTASEHATSVAVESVVLADHGEDSRSFFCRICPWWCDDPAPNPDDDDPG